MTANARAVLYPRPRETVNASTCANHLLVEVMIIVTSDTELQACRLGKGMILKAA
jgi:hypothetical protein